MSHYDSIDTNWDDPTGWGRQTIEFLNSLHPITGNLVEYAIRVRSCYQHDVVKKFIEKADAGIINILESCENHNPHEFNTRNYSAEDIARVVAYVRNVTRVFQMYYQVGDKDKWHDLLPCFDNIMHGFNVGQLGDILNKIEEVLENKFTRHCKKQVAKQEERTLMALIDILGKIDATTNKRIREN